MDLRFPRWRAACITSTVAVGLALPSSISIAAPPFGGTVWVDPNIITDADYSSLNKISYSGQGMRTMFDRRVNGWVQLNAYLFAVDFDNGKQIEFQVNPEFGSVENALVEVEFFAPVIGRIPALLLESVETSWIHMGDEAFGGGNNNLLIHVGSGRAASDGDFLEELFVHEAAHSSLDQHHANTPAWQAAQQSDGEFISDWAAERPQTEDVAESFLPFLAVRYLSDRISADLADTYQNTIPARLAYFDSLDLDVFPLGDPQFTLNAGMNDAWVSSEAPLQGLFITVFPSLNLVFVAWFTFDSEVAGSDEATFGASDQRWVTAIGTLQGNRANLGAEMTTGGHFNASDPVPVQDTDYGTINLEFSGCGSGVVRYEFPKAGLSGEFGIKRVVDDNIALCEALSAP